MTRNHSHLVENCKDKRLVIGELRNTLSLRGMTVLAFVTYDEPIVIAIILFTIMYFQLKMLSLFIWVEINLRFSYCCIHHLYFTSIASSGGSRISGGGASTPEFGEKSYYLATFLSKIAWKWKNQLDLGSVNGYWEISREVKGTSRYCQMFYVKITFKWRHHS